MKLSKYFGITFWNRKDKSTINKNSITENNQNGYCARWVEVGDLKEGMEIAVPHIAEKNNFKRRNSTLSMIGGFATQPQSDRGISSVLKCQKSRFLSTLENVPFSMNRANSLRSATSRRVYDRRF